MNCLLGPKIIKYVKMYLLLSGSEQHNQLKQEIKLNKPTLQIDVSSFDAVHSLALEIAFFCCLKHCLSDKIGTER